MRTTDLSLFLLFWLIAKSTEILFQAKTWFSLSPTGLLVSKWVMEVLWNFNKSWIELRNLNLVCLWHVCMEFLFVWAAVYLMLSFWGLINFFFKLSCLYKTTFFFFFVFIHCPSTPRKMRKIIYLQLCTIEDIYWKFEQCREGKNNKQIVMKITLFVKTCTALRLWAWIDRHKLTVKEIICCVYVWSVREIWKLVYKIISHVHIHRYDGIFV